MTQEEIHALRFRTLNRVPNSTSKVSPFIDERSNAFTSETFSLHIFLQGHRLFSNFVIKIRTLLRNNVRAVHKRYD